MTPERWRKVGEIFHAALEEPIASRKHWVESACAGDAELRAEVLSLLGSDVIAGDEFIEKKVRPAVASLLQANSKSNLPMRVGPYRLVSELGRGGMGAVYLADRDDDEYQAQVAVKLVRRGMDTDLILSRFYRERQTLARLQHPNIARLLDGGTTSEGDPYIVMEFVQGERITSYCQSRNLSVAQKLTLFLDVAKAVSYAHRQFVVHRDLKPGNILVDNAGQVKLLDFGICKLLQAPALEPDQTAEVALLALTPDYASPEQIRGDPITVASDIYSLGAVLYELLTGVKPHKVEDYSLRGMERAICETEIPRASVACPDPALARQLKGDLDNILNVALDKDPRRRYETVDRFAEDIQRYLGDEPVKARPDSVSYRVGKFIRRRREFVVAAAVVLVALSAGVVVAFRSARTAREDLRMVRQLSNTFLFEVHDAVRYLPGATGPRHLIVQTGLRYLENLSRRAAGDADFEHEVGAAYRRIGDVQGDVMNANLGNTNDALESYRKALMLLDSAVKKDPQHRGATSEQMTVYRRIGNIYTSRRDQQQALAHFRKGEGIAEELLARDPNDASVALQLGELQIASSNAFRFVGDWENARRGYAKAVTLLSRAEKAFPDNWETRMSLASAYIGVGVCDVRFGRFNEALKAYRDAASIRENLLKRDAANVATQRDLMIAYGYIGDLLGNPNLPNMGDPKGAVAAYERMLDTARRIHMADPLDQRARSDFAIALSRMAAVLPADDALSRIRMLTQAIQLQHEISQGNPENLSNRIEMAVNHNFLGDAYLTARDIKQAMRAYREGVRLAEPMFASATPVLGGGTALMYRKLGEALARNGDRQGALAYGQRAMDWADPAKSPAGKWPPNARNIQFARGAAAMGYIHAALARSTASESSDKPDARRWLQESLGLYRALGPQRSPHSLVSREIRAVEAELEKLK